LTAADATVSTDCAAGASVWRGPHRLARRRALFSQGRAVFAFPETPAAAVPSARPSAPSRLSSGPRDGAVLSSQPLGAGGIGPARGVQLAGPGKVPAVTCTCRKQPGVRYPSLCRPV